MDTLVTTIRKNIDTVTGRIHAAARSAGRNPNAVRLVVVTKAQPVELMCAAIDAGARLLGENYPEETAPKLKQLREIKHLELEDLELHMIGHLQSRKASLVVDNFQAMQSLDSIKLASKLESLLAEKEKILPVMLELNVGGEESKHGWSAWDEASWEALLPEVEQVLGFPHLNVFGLMTMPPLFEDPENSRPFFVKLRRLCDLFSRRFGEKNFSELSMGTSIDFETAVQEGATLVRIGQAITGPRPPR